LVPRISEFILEDMTMPAASSEAEIIRLPVESHSIEISIDWFADEIA
jgi:hypothetical protein